MLFCFSRVFVVWRAPTEKKLIWRLHGVQLRISPGFPILETSTYVWAQMFFWFNNGIPEVSPITLEIRCSSISVGDEKCVRKRVLASGGRWLALCEWEPGRRWQWMFPTSIFPLAPNISVSIISTGKDNNVVRYVVYEWMKVRQGVFIVEVEVQHKGFMKHFPLLRQNNVFSPTEYFAFGDIATVASLNEKNALCWN